MHKIRVFSVPWHVAHQYELTKFPFMEWDYLIQHTRKWAETARPFPKDKVKWVTHFDPKKYDLAVLHIDQQCLLNTLGKSRLFADLMKIVKGIPKIVINHGTNCYPEMLPEMARFDKAKEMGIKDKKLINEIPISTKEGIEWANKKMKKKLESFDAIIVNSHQAREEWGFGRTIWHGLDKNEWYSEKKEPRVTTFIAQAGLGNKYYGRHLFMETRAILREKYGIQHLWIGEEVMPDTGGFRNWEDYKKFLAGTLIYFNPTYGSPMPRSRTEAMLSGCAVVTTRHHDVERFIEHGKNGYICKDNPEHAAKLIADLYFNYDKAVKMGQEGMKTAQKVFSMERFQADWKALIEEVLGRKI